MKYTKTKNLITIYNPQDFNVQQTLDCGQIFRYVIEGNVAKVFSMDKIRIQICDDIPSMCEYFEFLLKNRM